MWRDAGVTVFSLTHTDTNDKKAQHSCKGHHYLWWVLYSQEQSLLLGELYVLMNTELVWRQMLGVKGEFSFNFLCRGVWSFHPLRPAQLHIHLGAAHHSYSSLLHRSSCWLSALLKDTQGWLGQPPPRHIHIDIDIDTDFPDSPLLWLI